MAVLTIVAVSSATPGLLGASSRPRPAHPTFDRWPGYLDGLVAEAGTPECAWAVARSRWDTRGWTFQERKLSRRMLLVDAGEAYVSCARGSFWEGDSRLDLHIDPTVELDAEDKMDTIEAGLHDVYESFSSYSRLVVAYSARQLSFRSDAVDAFMGVGNILAARMESRMLWGVPERWMMQGLMWRGRSFTKGRDADGRVPSWSWAAWEGKVDYGSGGYYEDWTDDTVRVAMDSFRSMHAEEVGSLVTFFCAERGKDGAVEVRRVEEARLWFGPFDLWDDDEFAECLVTAKERQRERPEDVHGAMVNFTWDRCCHNPTECLRRVDISDEARAKAETVPGSLAFTTTTAMLSLRRTKQAGKSEAKDEVCFDMVHFNDSFIGSELFVGQTMAMNRDWAEKAFDLSYKYRVVVLGAGKANEMKEKKYSSWRDCGRGTQFPLALYVMVTEEQGGVLYRLTVGIVNLLHWTGLKPAWESVVLG